MRLYKAAQPGDDNVPDVLMKDSKQIQRDRRHRTSPYMYLTPSWPPRLQPTSSQSWPWATRLPVNVALLARIVIRTRRACAMPHSRPSCMRDHHWRRVIAQAPLSAGLSGEAVLFSAVSQSCAVSSFEVCRS